MLVLMSVAGVADVSEKQPWFTWNLLWTGSWNGSYKVAEEDISVEEIFSDGTLLNRGDLRLNFPRQFLMLRFQALDRRRIPPDEKYQPVFNPGFGFYYSGGGLVGKYFGSVRLLYGVIEEQGLSARIRNVWAKSAPFAEYRRPFTVDLKNTVTSTGEPVAALLLETPRLGIYRGHVSLELDDEASPSFSAGAEAKWSKNESLRLDFFYTQQELEPKKSTAWFSTSPPLPQREFVLWAAGFNYSTQGFGFAADGAFSETFAFGRDAYLNAALRIGSKPWKFSIAADGAGPRFTDRAGAVAGEGFRLGSRLERIWIRSGLFRWNLLLRSSVIGEDFDRGSFSLYYRPSSLPPREEQWFRFTRASLGLSRDARNPQKTLDSFDLMGGFNFGSLRSVFSIGVDSVSTTESGRLFELPFFENAASAKYSCELARYVGIFDLRTKLSFVSRADKDDVWDFSLNASFRPVNAARFSLKIASPDFPEKWSYSLSYRLQI